MFFNDTVNIYKYITAEEVNSIMKEVRDNISGLLEDNKEYTLPI